MTQTAAPTADAATAPTEAAKPARLDRMRSTYREDHQNPVNHFLHVGVGWPIMAFAVILAPFRPWWALGLFCLSYAIMWTGHFVFERNLPTIFRHPTTPFVMAWTVMGQIAAGLGRLVTGRSGRA